MQRIILGPLGRCGMMKRWKVARVGLWSAVKIGCAVSCAVGFLIGLFWGVVFAFFSSLVAMAVSGRDTGIGIVAMAVLPVFCTVLFGAFGAGASFLLALVYNIIAGAFGGLEMEIETGEAAEYPVDTRNVADRRAVSGQFRQVWKSLPISLMYRRRIAQRRVKTGV